MTASGPETPTYLSPAGVHVPLVKKLARKVSPRLRTHAHWLIYDTPKVSEFFSARDAVMRIAHVSPETVLVLDGFPRSGNSYARAAFLYANGIHHKISTHGHSHRFPVRGAQEGIPVIVLIREPEAAIASMLQFEPTMDARLLANAYTRYYRGILPVIDSVVVAPFEEATPLRLMTTFTPSRIWMNAPRSAIENTSPVLRWIETSRAPANSVVGS